MANLPRKRSRNKSKEYYFDVTRDAVNAFHVHIKSKNGKVMWASARMTTKHNALSPVLSLVAHIGRKKCRVTYRDVTKNKSEVLV